MIPKAFFVVLLGAALVFASPIPESNDVAVPISPASDIESAVDAESSTEIDLDLFGDDDDHTEVTTTDVTIEGTTEASLRVEKGWKKVKAKWSKWIESGKQEWKNLKNESKEAYKKLKERFNVIKEKGLKLIDEAKETYNVVKSQGKEAIADFKIVYHRIRASWKSIKVNSKEAIDDVKQLFADAKKDLADVKSKWALVQKIG